MSIATPSSPTPIRRELNTLAGDHFDLIIIGGGITGVMSALEAVSRGIKTALIERDDYGHATSSCNSRLIHGGLRYLQQAQFRTVLKSVRERSFWLRSAPRLVRPLPFYIPIAGALERVKLRIGLALYDLMAFGSGWEKARGATINELHSEFPWMETVRYRSALRYVDAQMVSPERLLLAALQRAQDLGLVSANYAAATSLLEEQGAIAGVKARDTLSEDSFEIRGRCVLNASGAWIDEDNLSKYDHQRVLLSSGIHIVVPSLGQAALAISAAGSHFFVIPWRGHTLLGTTDRRHEGPASTYRIRQDEVDRLVDRVRLALPETDLKAADIQHVYGGLRPLAHQPGQSTYRASRDAMRIDHGRRGGPRGLFSIVGGKWTTARALAEATIDGLPLNAQASVSEDLDLAPVDNAHVPKTAALGDNLEHYRWMYGAALADLDRIATESTELADPLSGSEPLIAAQAVHAVRFEGAFHLRDVVLRRTQAGRLGAVPSATIDALAGAMGDELGWNEERRRDEIRTASAHPWPPAEAEK